MNWCRSQLATLCFIPAIGLMALAMWLAPKENA